MLRSGIIIPYIGAHASIPAGFVRETTFDGLFPKTTADATDPNNTGGAATHTHTSPAHSHTMPGHTHAYTTSASTFIDLQYMPGSELAQNNHTHTGTSGAVNSGGTTSSDAVTYGSVSNNPPYYDVIFIRATGAKSVPNDGIVLFNSASVPTGFYFCDGNNSTVDLRNKYLHGAATGADSGATGGSTTNTHDISHSHTPSTHTHTSSVTGYAAAVLDASGGGSYIRYDHTHTITHGAASQPIDTYTSSLITTETVEPFYKKLLAIQNKSGGGKNVIGQIALWLGTLATIPPGWKLSDGNNGTPDMRSFYLKIANTTGEIGNTGGANTHTHAAQSHQHTSTSGHVHSSSASAASGGTSGDTGAASGENNDPETQNHTHGAFNTNSQTITYNSSNTTADSSSNEPEYRTVAYIQMKQNIGGMAQII